MTMRRPRPQASAVPARMVSMLTRTPSGTSSRMTGRTRSQLLARRHPFGAGAGGLPSDVDDVRAVGDQPQPVGDCSVDVEVRSAVAERIGGDVEHPEDARCDELLVCGVHDVQI